MRSSNVNFELRANVFRKKKKSTQKNGGLRRGRYCPRRIKRPFDCHIIIYYIDVYAGINVRAAREGTIGREIYGASGKRFTTRPGKLTGKRERRLLFAEMPTGGPLAGH